MMLEGQRNATGAPMGREEAALDREIREFPRSPKTDPYKTGLERLASVLAHRLPIPLYVAYNEFCAPSVTDAVARAIERGALELVLVSSMMTPGGSHSEVEMPELVNDLQREYPQVAICYAWPFDLDALAGLLVDHLERFTQPLAS